MSGPEPAQIDAGKSTAFAIDPAQSPSRDLIIDPQGSSMAGGVGSSVWPFLGARYYLQLILATLPLLICDLIVMNAAAVSMLWLIGLLPLNPVKHVAEIFVVVSIIIPLLHTCFGLYVSVGLHPVDELRRIVCLQATVWSALTILSWVWHHNWSSPYLILSAGMFVLLSVGLPIGRSLLRIALHHQRWCRHPAVILGIPNDAVVRFAQAPQVGLCIDGYFAEPHEQWCHDIGCEYLGPLSEATGYARQNGVYWAILASAPRSTSGIKGARCAAESSFPHVLLVNDTPAWSGIWGRTVEGPGSQAIHLQDRLLYPGSQRIKRLFDLFHLAIGSLVAVPAMLLIFVIIKWTSPGPAFFRHHRVGANGKRFRVWKFRTMVTDGDRILDQYLDANPEAAAEWRESHKLKYDPRLTTIGRWLRAFSLDELPQLWNVLRGEMSLVGPRPLEEKDVSRYGNVYLQYARVRPGLTGLWQVSGRSDTTYSERIEFDEYYVRNWSIWLDLWILGRTITAVLGRTGAY